ncbi:MAG: phosphotransferase enzyme family protein [Butyricicoccus sp.]
MTNKNLKEQLAEVCVKFRIPGEVLWYKQKKSGNINTTYEVMCQEILANGKTKDTGYIVQKINSYVFRDPEAMMNNIDLVTEHIINKKKRATGEIGRRYRLHFHHTADGKNFWRSEDGSGEFWRLMNCIEDAVGFDESSDPRVLFMAGKAFGQFQVNLSDFDASQLVETIPNFHNTRLRLENFFQDVEADECGRCHEVQEEIATIRGLFDTACKLTDMTAAGYVPLRVTHNDTKSNNVLLDSATLEPLVVIDLDTVMPGLAMHDFGDAVRFAANTAAEDEADTSKVSLDLELYRAFAEGFIGATAGFLTKEEIDTMALGALTITIELAVRFLDDYITGDKYFKINYPSHNLVRARSQLALVKDMQKKFDDMDRIVHEVASKHYAQ